jgi:hypothetical protein
MITVTQIAIVTSIKSSTDLDRDFSHSKEELESINSTNFSVDFLIFYRFVSF